MLLHSYEINNNKILIFVWYDKPVGLTFKEEHKLDQPIKIFREYI
jgi:hypothetical protein